MHQDLHFVTFATRDLDAARRFYVDGLGWSPLLDVPGEILFFQSAPGQVLGLFDAVQFAEDLGLDAAPAIAGVTVAHNVGSPDAVRELAAAMRSAGGRVRVAPSPGAFGGIFHAIVEDPNGVVWELAHNPGWRVAEDGAVSFEA